MTRSSSSMVGAGRWAALVLLLGGCQRCPGTGLRPDDLKCKKSFEVLAVGSSERREVAPHRRYIVEKPSGVPDCSKMPTLCGIGAAEPLVPRSREYPELPARHPLQRYCVYEKAREGAFGVAPGAQVLWTDQHPEGSDGALQVAALAGHGQASGSSGQVSGTDLREGMHARFMTSVGPGVVQGDGLRPWNGLVAVLDDVDPASVAGSCPGGNVEACDWTSLSIPESHGVVMARLVRELACMGRKACIPVVPYRVLDTVVPDKGVEVPLPGVGAVGDTVSFIRALLRAIQERQGRPLVVNASVGVDGRQLAPAELKALADTLAHAAELESVVMVAAAGNRLGGTVAHPARLMLPAELGRGAQPNPIVVAVGGATAGRSLLGVSRFEPVTLPRELAVAPAQGASPMKNAPNRKMWTGTSVSTAVVSAAVAAAWSLCPDKKAKDIVALARTSIAGSPALPVDLDARVVDPAKTKTRRGRFQLAAVVGRIARECGSSARVQPAPVASVPLRLPATPSLMPMPGYVPVKTPIRTSPWELTREGPPPGGQPPSLDEAPYLLPQPPPHVCILCTILRDGVVNLNLMSLEWNPMEIELVFPGMIVTYLVPKPTAVSMAFDLSAAPPPVAFGELLSGRVVFHHATKEVTTADDLIIIE